ncbi:MFS transporter [Georgenia halophila]|uniref:MFS transporter n=1 Tax=Georgenia halophila TaxID=620889 RepID=A0ABP8L0E2_9MICO
MQSHARPSLLRNRDVALLWTAGLISLTGNLAMFVALPVAVFSSTSSAWATAATALAGAAPAVLVAQFAGVVADRVDRRRLLAAANVAMAVLTCAFLVLPDGSWWPYAAVNLIVMSAAQFVGPAEHALLGDLIPPSRLGEGASLNSLNNNIARLVGPALGGWVFAQLGFWATVILDAATFLVAALLVVGVSKRRRPPAGPRSATVGLSAEWLLGARRVWTHPALRPLVLLVAVVMFGEGAISALMAPFTGDVLGGGAGLLGAMLAAQAVGGIAGAWWSSRNADRQPPLQILAGASISSGLLLVVVFNYALLYPHAWPAVVLTGLAGFPFAVFGAAHGYALQIYAPPELRGRVYSLSSGVLSLARLSGITVAGLAAERWSALVINIDAAGYLVAGVIALRLTRRRRTLSGAPTQ